MSAIKRTQLYFSKNVITKLKKKISKEKAKEWTNDPLWDMVSFSSSKYCDLSVNHDIYLYVLQNI